MKIQRIGAGVIKPRWLSGVLFLLLGMSSAGSLFAQERMVFPLPTQAFTEVIHEVNPGSGTLVVSGRQYTLAPLVSFNGLTMEADRAMNLLSPEMRVQLFPQRSGSSVIVRISALLE